MVFGDQFGLLTKPVTMILLSPLAGAVAAIAVVAALVVVFVGCEAFFTPPAVLVRVEAGPRRARPRRVEERVVFIMSSRDWSSLPAIFSDRVDDTLRNESKELVDSGLWFTAGTRNVARLGGLVDESQRNG